VSSCCHSDHHDEPAGSRPKIDWLLWASLAIVTIALIVSLTLPDGSHSRVGHFCHAVRELAGLMWWGVLLGIAAVGVLRFVPQRMIEKWLGIRGNFSGLLRAVTAGILLDICSHGILLVSMQLYRRGLSLGQTMAFLIASPWNSFSVTIILFALVGLRWTLVFVLASAGVALLSGAIFTWMEKRGLVPTNPYRLDSPAESAAEAGFCEQIRPYISSLSGWKNLILTALRESRMIIRWIAFGLVLAAVLRTFVDTASFSAWFGPSLAGLALTLVAATVIEVCSEGSSPIAGDLLSRAAAPGNAFAFLMTGVATDYTEILSIRETMRSWKIALLLPAITIPQILLIGWILNRAS
jgi:uncharacterized protein